MIVIPREAIPLIGPYQGQVVKILTIDLDTGARRGWFTVLLPSGTTGLFAGEELIPVDQSPRSCPPFEQDLASTSVKK